MQNALEKVLKDNGTDVWVIVKFNAVPASGTIKGAYRLSYYVYSISKTNDRKILFTAERVMMSKDDGLDSCWSEISKALLESMLEYTVSILTDGS